MAERDWYAWHAPYDDPESSLSRRMSWVQGRVRAALDEAPPGPLRAISLCAGQGADLIVPLSSHPRRDDVTARLVELDPRNAAVARRLAAEAGLARLEVVLDDAALTSQYADMAPADLVLVCGVFGNITNADIERVIGYCRQLCATGGTVIWTRGRWEPDLVPQVCAWFEERGFDRVWLSGSEYGQCVGAHRFTGTPVPLERDAVMFRFNDHDVRRGPDRGVTRDVLRLAARAQDAAARTRVVPLRHAEQDARRVQVPRDLPDDPRRKELRAARPAVPAAVDPVQRDAMSAGRPGGAHRMSRSAGPRARRQILSGQVADRQPYHDFGHGGRHESTVDHGPGNRHQVLPG